MGCASSHDAPHRPDCDDEGPDDPRNGTWTKYQNIDMCFQGDVQIIDNWRSKHSVAEMKRIVEQNNWSAICVGSFDHAALKNFDFQLRPHHCKPSQGYTCTIFVYTPPPHMAKPEGGPKPNLVLVGMTDPRRITLANHTAIAAGQQMPLTLSSHPGYAICRQFPERRTAFREWDYTALGIGPAEQAVTCGLVGHQLVEGATQGVITPSMMELKKDNHFDLVWHKYNHPARLHAEASMRSGRRPLDVSIDPGSGAVAPLTSVSLCFGVEFSDLPPLQNSQLQQAQPIPAGFVQPAVVVPGVVVPGPSDPPPMVATHSALPPMGLPVEAGPSYPAAPPSYPEAPPSYPAAPLASTPMGKGAAAAAPPLHTMVEILKSQLGLGNKLNMQEAVDLACAQLGVDATQGNLTVMEKAQTCWNMLGCPSA